MEIVRAVRSLWRDRRFAAPMVAILALALAAATATFSVVDSYLFRPLPYPDADRIVQIRQTPRAPDWREEQSVFETVAAWDLDGFVILNGEYPEEVMGSWVSPGFFTTLGARTELGRVFTEEDYAGDAAAVAVLSHDLWQSRFGGRSDVVGETFRAFSADRPAEAQVFTVIGVLAEDFWYPSDFAGLLAPLQGARTVSMAKLREGVTPAQASAVLSRAYAARTGETGEAAAVDVIRMQDFHAEQIRPRLRLLLLSVLLMLLIATVNASALLLVRATVRQRELSLRIALGAGRTRLVRQLFAEGFAVASMAVGLGTFTAWLGTRSLASVAEARLGARIPGGVENIALDVRTLGVALALTLACTVLLSLIPLAALARVPLAKLMGGMRGSSAGPGTYRLRGGLVAAEIAISLVLLLAAGLLGRSALHQQRLELGFEHEGLLTGMLLLRQQSYPDVASRAAFMERLVARLESDRQVLMATAILPVPLGTRMAPSAMEAEGGRPGTTVEATTFRVLPGALADLGITLVRGRAFGASDNGGSEPVAVVSQRLARALWGERDPLGQRVRPAAQGDDPDAEPWLRVIGVSEDVRVRPNDEDPPDLYRPLAQTAFGTNGIVVRTRGAATDADALLRAALRDLDPELAVARVSTAEDLLGASLAEGRFLAGFLTAFAILAVLLSMFGLYTVVSYAVEQRRREVAIRLSLGARSGQVVRLFMQRMWVVVTLGLAAGALASMPLSRFLGEMLEGVTATDPLTWLLVVSAITICGLLATWIPAQRAGSTDPAEVLRND